MARSSHPSQSYLRARIAQLAARLMAEGIEDFALAKRKAARQLGAPLRAKDTQHLPHNSEVEEALRAYQTLFQGPLQISLLRQLRLQAQGVMRELAQFEPLLTGSVLHGTATQYSDIHLLLFADSQKDVAHYLLNKQKMYTVSEKNFRFSDGPRVIPVLVLNNSDAANVELAIFSKADHRCLPLSPVNGQVLHGVRLKDMQSLLEIPPEAVLR